MHYNAAQVPLRFILELYFKAIDPTSLNRQGNDIGRNYRTGIYYTKSDDLKEIKEVMAQVQKQYDQPLAVEVKHLAAAAQYRATCLEKIDAGMY